nr:meiotic recombination protein DMC1 homolog [Ipomoea batatas]
MVFRPEEQLQIVEREEIDDEEDLFEAIDKLTSHGINAGDVKKLQDAGIYTCNGLMMHTKKNLTGIKGLSEAKVDKICEAAEKIVNFGYITGSDALLKRKSVVHVTTGSQALDELLGGGIETSAITEAFGEFRSGKTQLAHTLCVSTQLPTSMKGGNGKVAYIDTEGTFRPDRILPIAERFGMDAGAVLDNIVDSVIALFRVDFTGRGELAERQQKLAQMLSRLTKIAEEFNVAVYMTNQVIADPGGGVFISDPKKPAGGHVLAHAATIRLMFRKGKGEQRVCKVFDAPNLPENEAISFHYDEGKLSMKISHNLISRVRTPVPQRPVCLNDNDHLICSLVQPILLFQMRHVLNVALKQAEYIIHNGEQPNRENKLVMSDKSRFKIYKASKSESPETIKKHANISKQSDQE